MKPKSLSKDGGTITTPNDHIVHWAAAHLRQRPSSRWTKGQSCTNFQFEPLKRGCSLVPYLTRTLVIKNIRKTLNSINKIWLMGKSVVLHQENNIKCQYGTKTPIHRAVTYNRTHGNALTHSCNTKIKQSPRLRFTWENPKAFARCNVYWPTKENPKSLLCAKFID